MYLPILLKTILTIEGMTVVIDSLWENSAQYLLRPVT